jgi:hypothetical protein
VKKGSSRFTEERIGIFLNVEKSIRELARTLKMRDAEAYTKGVLLTANERCNELSEQQFTKGIQIKRAKLEEMQNEIAQDERIALDLRIRSEARMKKKTVVLTDKYGKPMVDRDGKLMVAVMAE